MLTEHQTKLVKLSSAKAEIKAGEGERLYTQLNGLRFLFIFMVLIHHWGPQKFFEQYRWGWLGVDLFFVLSGFLIGEILLLEKSKTNNKFRSIKNFVMRRVLRIFPLYYLTILVYSVFVTTGGILLWNLTYTNNILQTINIERVSEEFWHLWSLCVEEQFYLFFPLFIFFTRRTIIPYFLVSGILISVAGRFIATSFYDNAIAYTLMPLCLDSLFMGVLLAYLKSYHFASLKKNFSKGWIVASTMAVTVLGLFVLCYKEEDVVLYSFFRLFGSILGFLVIGYSVMIGYRGVLKNFLEHRFISLLGKISYGIYLVHPFIEKLYFQHAESNFLRKFLINLHQPIISNTYFIDFISLFAITIAISHLSFHFFEKKFLQLKHLFA